MSTTTTVPGGDRAVRPPTAPLVRLDHVSKHFTTKGAGLFSRRTLTAVDDVSLDLPPAHTFALVGESGSGKSTLGRLALRLTEPSSGRVHFEGRDLTAMSPRQLRRTRQQMQVVFQDPLGSLDPRMSVADIVAEPLRVHRGLRGSELDDRVAALFEQVGLDTSRMRQRPKALSGGQRQRVGIARAIALEPRLLLADEAVSALDVSVQAQITNLLAELRERLGLTYLFIAHGLPVVRQIADTVGVMYLGRVVEQGPVDEIFSAPAHPYTKALISAQPVADPTYRRERVLLQGEIPSATAIPSGCRFRTRCPIATATCAEVAPPRLVSSTGHVVECHYPLEEVVA
ncbi:ABC transporter ATP-binding protein [Auraticoccus cholistanensis]|uniref:ABC transporter ATP-binding protein n=1 Tax=Auraticoccus cholistanensis TaxID=2656650 RepID=UPI0018D20708|nr:ABC transporter ATP-binding protein [Auraticoccus cholistanensis]